MIKTHYEEYEQIKDKAVLMSGCEFDKMDIGERDKLLSEKTVITTFQQRPACAYYEIKGNASGLSDLECAIIADRGNLCFGYRMEGKKIVVYTD